MINLVICDLDGFLVETWGEKPLSGVVETLAELRKRGIHIAVATNQAGPFWREATGNFSLKRYPSVQEVATRLLACTKALDLETDLWCVALSDERVVQMYANRALEAAAQNEPTPLPSAEHVLWRLRKDLQQALSSLPRVIVSTREEDRKPNPGMLHAACTHWNVRFGNAIYGGGMDTDRQAAEAAGIRFVEKLSDVLTLLEGEQ